MYKRAVKTLANKEFRNYIISTHFWGPVILWAVPLAAIRDTQRDAKYISGNMTFALMVYSAMFMRFAYKVQPRNMLLFVCHFTNLLAQSVQFVRFLNYCQLKKTAAKEAID